MSKGQLHAAGGTCGDDSVHFYLGLSICISIECIAAAFLIKGENTLQGKDHNKDHFDGSHAFMISINRLFYWEVVFK